LPVRKPIKKLLVRGEEAEVYRFGNDRLRTPKRDVVRVKRFTLNTRKYTFKKFRELKLANALFPGLFIDVTKSVLTKNKFGMNKLYSRYEETTPEYKEFVKEFYA